MFKRLVFLALISTLTYSQTTYIWTGAVNANFSTAGNWSPIRQVGYPNDILIFENGQQLNVQNVNQVTIGQLIIRNNTELTLSPSAGNIKTIILKGCEGSDLIIEHGSTLKISGNDPQLNLYFLNGASAEISGKLTFQGSIAHNINAAEENSIHFRNGSVLEQLSPGYIFNSTGTRNVAAFDSGSEFIMNHPQAQNPFALSAPDSKINFDKEGSILIRKALSFSLNGRKIGNLIIENGSHIQIIENFKGEASINNLTVKQDSELDIINTSESPANLIFEGNLNIEGSFKLNSENPGKMNAIFKSTAARTISGNGDITLGGNLTSVVIYSDIKLMRDISINCNFKHTGGIIEYNNFHIYTPNARTSEYRSNPFMHPVERINSIESLPHNYSLSQNYPNPFNPSTQINFSIPVDSKVTIKVYDITGKEAAVLINEEMPAGYHTSTFNAAGLSSGIYFYTITAGEFKKTLKMILSK